MLNHADILAHGLCICGKSLKNMLTLTREQMHLQKSLFWIQNPVNWFKSPYWNSIENYIQMSETLQGFLPIIKKAKIDLKACLQ